MQIQGIVDAFTRGAVRLSVQYNNDNGTEMTKFHLKMKLKCSVCL